MKKKYTFFNARKIIKRTVKLLTVIIPFKKARYCVYDFLANGGWKCLFSGTKIRLNYYTSELNFGDILNEDLMKFFGFSYCHTYSKYADWTCIGSLLQDYLLKPHRNATKRPMHIFGSGFIQQENTENETFCRPMIFHALRGKLSQKRCEKILGKDLHHIPLGDPGLLIRRIFPHIQPKPVYDVGVIFHYSDKDSPYFKSIQLKNLRICFIDVSQKTESFVKQVSKCKFILSSALHGLICADSLSIPNKHIVFENKIVGGEYKFRDYYSVFKDVVYTPVYLKNTPITNKDIQKFTSEYSVKKGEVDAICDALTDVFLKMKSELK